MSRYMLPDDVMAHVKLENDLFIDKYMSSTPKDNTDCNINIPDVTHNNIKFEIISDDGVKIENIADADIKIENEGVVSPGAYKALKVLNALIDHDYAASIDREHMSSVGDITEVKVEDCVMIEDSDYYSNRKHEGVLQCEEHLSDDRAALAETPLSNQLTGQGVSTVLDQAGVSPHRTLNSDYKKFCEMCPKQAANEFYQLTHYGSHAITEAYSCNRCSYVATLESSIISHVRIHSGEEIYSCGVCNKTYNQRYKLKIHLRTHTGEKPFSCDICNKSFAQKSHFTTHMKIHTGVTPFWCKICNRVYNRKSGLAVHMKIHYTQNILYMNEDFITCNICLKVFKRRSFDLHFRTHSGKKLFSCNLCDKAFVAEGRLRRHMNIHSKDNPNSCHICHKVFDAKSSLTLHLRSHTGEKPFSCNICNKPFAYKCNLSSHMNLHSGSSSI